MGSAVRAAGAATLVVFCTSAMLLNVGFATGGGAVRRSGAPTSQRPARVLGFLVARVSKQQQVFVPNVRVVLKRPAGRTLATVRTDLSGRFEFPTVKKGKAQVCWQAFGFVPGCTAPFAVSGFDRYLGTRSMRARPGKTALFGQARLRDGSNPRTWEPMANVNAFATVTAVTRGGARLAPGALVNNYGDFVVAGLPRGKAVFLRSALEGARTLVAAGPSPAAAFRRLDLTLPNTPPEIAGLLPETGGEKHWSAAPGARVTVNAITRDADGDAVTVRWTLPDGTSPPSRPGDTSVSFTLPARVGEFQFHAVAYDGKGGYAEDSVAISTRGIRFSGRVRATNAPFVPGALVAIGGRTATTDENGRFELVVDEAPRYAIEISKPGYMPVSSVSDLGVLGGEWTLTRASVSTADPTQAIDVTNRRLPSDCPGLPGSQPGGTGKQGECGPGIRVAIPPNALVGANGQPPAGPVSIALATVDPGSPDQMPGDATAVDANGKPVRLVPFGAGYVEITAGGTTYNLKPGATATVTIPISPGLLAAGVRPPESIPLLTYVAAGVNDKRSTTQKGVWVTEGTATRSGNAYVAAVQHFSFIGLDVTRPDPACIRLDAVGMPQQFDLQVTGHDEATGAPIVRTVPFENSAVRFHLIQALPVDDHDIQFRAFVRGTATPIVLALPNPTGAQPPPTGTVLTADSGAPATLSPPFPYTTCHGFSGPAPGALPSAVLVQAAVPENVVDEFLNFGAAAENLSAKPGKKGPWEAQARRYYNKVDPLHKRRNVGDFRAVNHFDSTEVTAAYANSADLGFGREMHCQRHVASDNRFDVACYVTNYGNKDSDDFDDFVQALTALGSSVKDGAIATVGMEYSRIENPKDPTGNTYESKARVVKFYVWAGPPATAGNQLAPSADLDGFGARPVPQLCQECHGGHYTGASKKGVPKWTAASANLHANFIPFDLRGLSTPSFGGVDYKATQQAAFKALNQIVLNAKPGRAVRVLIAGMYPHGSLTQRERFATAGWRGRAGSPSPRDFYNDVVAASCRTCHYSQDTSVRGSPTRTFNDWDKASELTTFAGTTGGLVCQQQVMPHALITHRRFWLAQSPEQPKELRLYLHAHGASATVVRNCR